MVVSPKGDDMAESTRYAVLGLVARQPAHGYALYSEIERWPLPDELRPGRSTVYRHLERLHGDQLIESRRAEGPADPGRPDRTVVAVTDAGLKHLDDYVRTRPRSFDELCVRIAACRPEDVPLLIRFAAELEQASLQRFQEWSLRGEAVALARRNAPWRSVMQAIVAKAQAADVAGLATVLGDMRSELEALERER